MHKVNIERKEAFYAWQIIQPKIYHEIYNKTWYLPTALKITYKLVLVGENYKEHKLSRKERNEEPEDD